MKEEMKEEITGREAERDKAHLAGLNDVATLLKANGVEKETIGRIMGPAFHETLNTKLIGPSLVSLAESFRADIQRALSQVRKGNLKGHEALMRLDIRLDCPREDHTITKDEIKYIRHFLNVGFGISEVARIFERSKSTISDIAHKKTHTTTDE